MTKWKTTTPPKDGEYLLLVRYIPRNTKYPVVSKYENGEWYYIARRGRKFEAVGWCEVPEI
jgi:hypothetical protein